MNRNDYPYGGTPDGTDPNAQGYTPNGYPYSQNGNYTGSPYGQGGYGSTPSTGSPYGQGGYGSIPSTGSPYGQGGYGSTPSAGSPYGQGGYGSTPSAGSTYGQGGYGSTPSTGGSYGQGGYGSTPSAGSPYGQGGYGSTPSAGGSYGQGGYGSTPSAGGPYGQGGYGSFGTDTTITNNEPGYDPNAPIYHPLSDSSYDPNAPLYHPEPSSQVHTATVTPHPSKGKSALVGIVILVVAVLAVVGVFALRDLTKVSIKDYMESSAGQKEMAELNQEVSSSADYTCQVYANDNNQLVFEYTLRQQQTFSASELAIVQQSMDSYMESGKSKIANLIDDHMKNHNVREFSVVYIYRNKNGTELYSKEIFLSDK